MVGAKQKQKNIPEKNYENKYVQWVTLVLFLFSIFVLTTYKIEDDDVFWHLATGRFIAENKYVPDTDVFGFSTQNDKWIPFEWGSDLISYALYNAGGYTALSVFRSVTFCLMFLIYFMLLRKFRINSAISFILLFALLMALFDRLSPRPHIFTYLFLVVLLYLLLTYKFIDREKYFKRLYFLPLIFLFWGNLHPGVIAGGTVLFVFVLSELIEYRNKGKKKKAGSSVISKEHLYKLLIISAASVFILLINPHGINTYLYIYNHTGMKMLESIAEWQNPFTGKIEVTFVVTLYKVLLFAGIIVLFYAYKTRNFFAALLYIAFVLYSIRAIRFTADYEIIMLFFIAAAVNYFLIQYFKKGNDALNFKFSNAANVVLALVFIYVSSQAISDNLYYTLKFNRNSGWGIYENMNPVKLYDFLESNKITGTPYNNFETGGYHIWKFPHEKNFIDSRNINDNIFNEYMSILYMNPGFEKKLEHYGIDYAVYFDPKMAKYPNSLKQNIVSYFCKNENWKLVYWDDKSMLFLKNIPKFGDLINKFEYKVFNPYTAVFNRKEFESNLKNNPYAAKNEIKRKTDTEPQGYFFLGMNDIALKILQEN